MKNMRNVAVTLAIFAGSLGAWEAVVRAFEIPIFILPPPSQVAMALYRGIASGLYINHLGYTLLETLLGFIAGSLLGFFLGTAVAMNRWVEFFLYPYIVMFQSLPKVALAPLIVVWFGLGLTSKVINAALVAFFPLLVNTMVGLKSADEDRVSLMRSLAASDRQIFWMLRLPNALPFVMAGLDVAMIFALIGAIVAEFVGAQRGLGMLADPIDELQHGRLRPVLDSPHPVLRRTRAQPRHHADSQACDVLGPVREAGDRELTRGGSARRRPCRGDARERRNMTSTSSTRQRSPRRRRPTSSRAPPSCWRDANATRRA